MLQPRTVKTLVALLAAMTLGTILLISIDAAPIRPPGTHLAAVAAADEMELPVVTQTDVPLRKWKNIIVHTSVEGADVANRCHFVIDSANASETSTSLPVRSIAPWIQQTNSLHTAKGANDWNTDSIGVCLMGDFSRRRPSPVQWQAMVKLTNDLQKRFKIPAERVYLYRDIGGAKINSPGSAFSQKEFDDALLTIDR